MHATTSTNSFKTLKHDSYIYINIKPTRHKLDAASNFSAPWDLMLSIKAASSERLNKLPAEIRELVLLISCPYNMDEDVACMFSCWAIQDKAGPTVPPQPRPHRVYKTRVVPNGEGLVVGPGPHWKYEPVKFDLPGGIAAPTIPKN